MSTLAENVAKVTAAHAALKEAIAAKGVALPEGTKLSGMPALVEQIETPPVPTNPRAVFAYDVTTSLAVPKVLVVDFGECRALNYCFYNCSALTSLTLPAGFGQNATSLFSCFYNCSVLTSLTLPAGFGQNATDLGNCFDNCSGLTSLTLPDGFGQNATDLGNCFDNCSGLTSLTLPDGFGQVATGLIGCFRNCSGLTSLTLPDGFGQNEGDLYYCFSNCSRLTSLTLPDGFGQNAANASGCFSNCLALTDITGNPNFKASVSLSSCTNITHDSLMVVINGLQTVTTTKKLTLGATNLAKLTDEEKKIATDKGWTLA